MLISKPFLLALVILLGASWPCPAQEEEGEESAAEETQAGGSPITQDASAQGLSGTGGGRQDAQSKSAAENPAKPANPAKVSGGGGGGGGGGSRGSGGGGGGGAKSAAGFGSVDIDKVKPLGGHGELGLPPGAAWAIRFKTGASGHHTFCLETRTGSNSEIHVKTGISSKPGVVAAGKGCQAEGTVYGFPCIGVYIGGKAPKWGCALKPNSYYYYNVVSDGGCTHPDAIMRGCPALFSVSNGGICLLAPDGADQCYHDRGVPGY